MKTETLECVSIDKSFGRRKVLKQVTISAQKGEVVGILGPNGAGKTTAFKSILGIVIPDNGEVYIGEEPITHLPVHERAKKGIAYLPQETSIFRGLSVIDNLIMILKLTRKSDHIIEKANELLEDFGILHLRNQMADVISGGEQRRLEFARTLALSPRFILLDEPFVGIDPITLKDIQKMIINLKKRGIGVIVTDHDVTSISKVVDSLYILFKGEVISSGDPQTVLAEPAVIDNYLGKEETT
ncbi:MAG: LPS export ABC transporter ATP-binding protein [Thermotogota bacterium]|nr:LPS export ABC transporter ATP-binding protein [Thermotogota bacterium]